MPTTAGCISSLDWIIIFTTCTTSKHSQMLGWNYSHLTCECCQSPQSWQSPRVSSSRSGTLRSLLDEGKNSCSPGTGSSGTWPRCPRLLTRPVATWGCSPGPLDSLSGQNWVRDETYTRVKEGETVDIYAIIKYASTQIKWLLKRQEYSCIGLVLFNLFCPLFN